MYAENGGQLRAQLGTLLRQHRIQQRLGGAGSHTIPETTTVDERRLLGEQIARYRQSALVWSVQAVRAANPRMNLVGTSTRARSPADELGHRLDITIEHSSGPPSLEELTTEQQFPMVETWRNVARAAALGEHDFDAGLGHGRLTRVQCMTLLKDASDVVRGLVALDRRYSNIPQWQPLKDAGWLNRAAETCSTFAGRDEPDYTIDLRGWRPRIAPIDGTGLPGIVGVLQAENNLLFHLGSFPDARSLRLILDSQRIVSRDAADLVKATHPDLAQEWRARSGTYLRLARATRDIGGMLGNGGPAAGEAALAAARVQHLDVLDAAAYSNALRHLDNLFRGIDDRIAEVIQQGARERIYFARVPLPRLDTGVSARVTPTRHRFTPITADVCPALLDIVRDELRAPTPASKAPTRAAASRAEFAAALNHRPEPRRAQSGPSL
jgi:hypothetical protein